jgi:hypothetical protein
MNPGLNPTIIEKQQNSFFLNTHEIFYTDLSGVACKQDFCIFLGNLFIGTQFENSAGIY